jgi:hypothetical protein
VHAFSCHFRGFRPRLPSDIAESFSAQACIKFKRIREPQQRLNHRSKTELGPRYDRRRGYPA